MNTKLFDTKTIKKNLANYDYVMALQSLTPEERKILSTRYRESVYHRIKLPLRKIKNIADAHQVFQQALKKAEQYVRAHKVSDAFINNVGYYNSLIIRGYYIPTDLELIKLHKRSLTRIKKYKEEVKQRRKRIAEQRAKYKAQAKAQAKAQTKVSNAKSIIVCSNRTDAQDAIAKLKQQFNL
jgi:hypothetical protein